MPNDNNDLAEFDNLCELAFAPDPEVVTYLTELLDEALKEAEAA